MVTSFIALSSLKTWEDNYNEGDIGAISISILEFGYNRTVSVWQGGVVMAGNHTFLALTQLKAAWLHSGKKPEKVPPGDQIEIEGDEWLIQYSSCAHLAYEKAKAYAIADNRMAALAVQDDTKLFEYLKEIAVNDPAAFAATGYDKEDLADLEDFLKKDSDETKRTTRAESAGKLLERFGENPFTILDARSQRWQDRKRAWKGIGLNGYAGREGVVFGNQRGAGDTSLYNQQILKEKYGRTSIPPSYSVFDPVLCELIYRWFCIPNGRILDPFAGGSNAGIVAGYMGYHFTGVELRKEQVESNYDVASKVGVSGVEWINGDTRQLDSVLDYNHFFDLIFSDPPYWGLERYAGGDKDASNFKTYEEFIAWYRECFSKVVPRLKEDRFLVVKIGEIRDKKGNYVNFVGDNISIFRDLGLNYYNESILVTVVGALALRVNAQFSKYRKLGKCHQNVLMFYKGDVRNIKDHYPETIQLADIQTETAVDEDDYEHIEYDGIEDEI